MPKRRPDERGGGRKATRPTRRHLYLVLDDWSSGYTIRKIDLLVYPGASCQRRGREMITGGFLGKQRLPPPIMRLEAPRGSPTRVVAAGGSSKLMFLQPSVDGLSTKPPHPCRDFVSVVDVRMRSTTLGPRPTDDPVDPIYMPVGGGGDWLFALDSGGGASFSVLCCPAPLDDPQESWSWRALPDPPFDRRHVVSYAARPDGGLVVGTKADDDDDDSEAASFAFTMAGAKGKPEWSRHGMFLLFAGRGHFDTALNAFVGLSGAPGSAGHLCLVYMADGSRKLSKERLFGEDRAVERHGKPFGLGRGRPVERQVGSTLVYMGGKSNFCLVECFCHGETATNGSSMLDYADQMFLRRKTSSGETMDDNGQDVSRHSCCSFRLTAFFLKHDKNGDVEIVILRVLYFDVPEGVTQLALKNPAAFWM